MSSGNSVGLVTALTTTAGLVAAVLGIVRYFNYRTKRDRIAAVGTAFEAVVEALASDDDVKRIAAAIRLRRFFDPRGELATGGLWPPFRQLRAREGHQAERATNQNATAGTTEGMPRHRTRLWKLTRDELPYAADALNVIVAILREQPPGNFQKLLADALTKAPKELLAGADIQKANLQNAWLGPHSAELQIKTAHCRPWVSQGHPTGRSHMCRSNCLTLWSSVSTHRSAKPAARNEYHRLMAWPGTHRNARRAALSVLVLAAAACSNSPSPPAHPATTHATPGPVTESFVHNRFTVTLSTEALEKASADGTNLPQVIASSLAGPGLGVTLLEDIISEGISSAFDTAAFPGPPDPWDRAISRTQECASWKKAQPLLQHTKLYDEWMFGGPGIPHWTAFTIGYDIVTDYHQHHPDTSWPTITSTSAYAILAGSRYQPCSS